MRTRCSFLLASVLGLAGSLHAQAPEPYRFENMPRWYDYDTDTGTAKPASTESTILDFDGDGDPDVARVVGGRIELGRNDLGAFTLQGVLDPSSFGPFFGPAESYWAHDVEAADVDGDGFTDLVVVGSRQFAPPFEALLDVFLGDGAGGFQPLPIVSLSWPGFFQLRLHLAQLDGDGVQDVVAWSQQTDDFVVRLATGSEVVYSLPADPDSLDTGDLDGDGATDIALVLEDEVQIRLNDGAGGFGGFASAGTPQAPTGLKLVDVDDDLDLDLVTTRRVSPYGAQVGWTRILVFPNDGTGSFGEPIDSHVFNGAASALDIEPGFLDSDAHVDLALAFSERTVVTVTGDGSGRFELSSAVSVEAEGMELVDLTGAGSLALLEAEGTVIPIDDEGRVGGTTIPQPKRPKVAPRPQAALDFDRDGLADLALYDAMDVELRIHLADGEGGFGAPLSFPAPADLARLASHDVDGDGFVDLVLTEEELGQVAVLLNQGGVGLGSPQLSPLPSGSIFNTTSFDLGDLDGDGFADYVHSHLHSTSGELGFGVGDGTFTSQPFAFPIWPGDVVIDELTGDANPDLVFVDPFVAAASTGQLWVLPGLGAGAFGPPIVSTFPGALERYVTTGDFDLDGDVDAVAIRKSDSSSGTPNALLFLTNDGTGAVAPTQTITLPGGLFDRLHLADLDEDGWPELVAGRAHFTLHVYRNEAGVFAETSPAWEFTAAWGGGGVGPEVDLDIADFDGDTLPDFAVGGVSALPVDNEPAIYFNRSQLRRDGRARLGNTVALYLDMPRSASQPFFLAASTLGTWPGIDLGTDVVPLNFDPVLAPLLLAGGAGVIVPVQGLLTSQGKAEADLVLPAGLPLVGELPLDLAFVSFDAASPSVVLASNGLAVTLRP